ncbi:60S ribosomal protein L24-like [Penaeus japonicus]|uniref:60S ribosomal protein L24-like n=1 Tax=Penaeus japonicus TaxID=27405 RepID=UPI001C71436A|nr:60S ribosomal protein L24-like [Penaeus japonicus]
MKIQLCSFSGYKIQPGRGKTMVRTDGRVMVFLNARCEAAYLMKKNPREVKWTVLYRRLHKKGVEEEVAKRRTRRTQKFQRAIVGASLTDIMAKRNMKPEVRKAQREQAIRAAKEKAKAAKAAKAAAKKPAAPQGGKQGKASQKVPKVQKGGRPAQSARGPRR